MQQETSLLEAIFREAAYHHPTGCKCFHAPCTCHLRRNSRRLLPQNQQAIGPQELEWALNSEEERELGRAFQTIRDLARKGYNKAKPWIVTADIIRRLIAPPTGPAQVPKDVASYIEQNKKRQVQERVEGALVPTRRRFRQKPPEEELSSFQDRWRIAKPSVEWEYYEAIRTPRGIMKGRQLTGIQAQERIRRGADVIADTKAAAKRLSKEAVRGKPIEDPGHILPSGDRGYPHLHVAGRRTRAHIFFPPSPKA